MQTNKTEELDPEWIDLLLEALDINISSEEISNFLRHTNQS
ncbi:anti-repressor SinI family protein [Bacillus rhizoplanae]